MQRDRGRQDRSTDQQTDQQPAGVKQRFHGCNSLYTAASSSRLLAPVFRRILFLWVLTVLLLIFSIWAICKFERPCASKPITCNYFGVNTCGSPGSVGGALGSHNGKKRSP